MFPVLIFYIQNNIANLSNYIINEYITVKRKESYPQLTWFIETYKLSIPSQNSQKFMTVRASCDISKENQFITRHVNFAYSHFLCWELDYSLNFKFTSSNFPTNPSKQQFLNVKNSA